MGKSNNFKIVFTVTTLLVALSLSISIINFMLSLDATQKDLKTRSLPLSVDNIYTEIQTHIIEPNLVSSMMAHDTFVKDWLIHEEESIDKIKNYLETIKNKYGMFVTFLVSEKTHNYYTHNGLLEKIDKEKKDNQWYFRFKNIQDDHEINLDYNDNLDNSLIMFINYKMFDENFHLIGATGIGLNISYIDDMLQRFRQQYNFKVLFVDESGRVVLSQRKEGAIKNLSESPEMVKIQDKIIAKTTNIVEYEKNGNEYIINTKYIPELDLYLIVEVKLDDFTEDVHKTFYFNLAASLIITLLVALVIIYTIKEYNQKLEFLAQYDSLTKLLNRRAFNEMFNQFFALSKRNDADLSLLFFDIDNFKKINDSLGHHTGDEILKRIAELLKLNIRESDLIARWGGEEFIIALINSNEKDAEIIAEKLRVTFEDDSKLLDLAKFPVTASFGITYCHSEESVDSALLHVDNAMYKAKRGGKNRVSKS